MPRPITGADIADAVNHVLSEARRGGQRVTGETRLASLDLDSQDYIEVFILLEEQTGAVFDLSLAPPDLERVADLARYRRVN
jgi:acyl carrier protein